MEKTRMSTSQTLLTFPQPGRGLTHQVAMIPDDLADYVVQQKGPW